MLSNFLAALRILCKCLKTDFFLLEQLFRAFERNYWSRIFNINKLTSSFKSYNFVNRNYLTLKIIIIYLALDLFLFLLDPKRKGYF